MLDCAGLVLLGLCCLRFGFSVDWLVMVGLWLFACVGWLFVVVVDWFGL